MLRVIDHVRRQGVGYLALFIAVGGTSYAAVALPHNSVGTAQLRHAAVTATKVKPHSLLAIDFKRGQLTSTRGQAGPQGPQGAQGPAGPQGPKGDPGATNIAVRSVVDSLVPNGVPGAGQAACLPGERATGGGGLFQGLGTSQLVLTVPVRMIRDASGKPTGTEAVPPGQAGDGWVAEGINTGPPRDFVTYVVCVSP